MTQRPHLFHEHLHCSLWNGRRGSRALPTVGRPCLCLDTGAFHLTSNLERPAGASWAPRCSLDLQRQLHWASRHPSCPPGTPWLPSFPSAFQEGLRDGGVTSPPRSIGAGAGRGEWGVGQQRLPAMAGFTGRAFFLGCPYPDTPNPPATPLLLTRSPLAWLNSLGFRPPRECHLHQAPSPS